MLRSGCWHPGALASEPEEPVLSRIWPWASCFDSLRFECLLWTAGSPVLLGSCEDGESKGACAWACSFLLSYSIDYQGTEAAAGRGEVSPRSEAPRNWPARHFIQELLSAVKGEPSNWPLPTNLRQEGVRLRNCPLISGWADAAMTAGLQRPP